MFDLSFANSTGSRMLALLVSLAATPLLAQSQYNISVLYAFTGSAITGNDLEGPGASLIADAKGNFYGTATNGSGGGVFELSPPSNGSGPWTETVLYAFQDGADGGTPLGSLLLDSAGTIYGTASAGGSSSTFCGNYTGCGVVFKLSPSSGGTGPWTESVLYTFTGGADGLAPSGNLAFDSKGNLYGATTYGGLSTICAASQQLPGCGVVFELNPPAGGSGPWSEQVIYTFKGGADGGYPFNLTIDSTGNLYGGAILGGDTSACSATGCGVIFELTPAGGGGPWTEAVLHAFTGSPSDGANPIGTLAFGSNGSLYGTTFSGGTGTTCSPGLSIGLAAGCGTVFQLTSSGNSSWSEALLHNFIGTDLASPYAGVILDAAGNLYGTALSGTTAATAVGGIFEISLSSGTWTENVLYAFNQSDGTDPYGGLTFDSKGNIFGTTAYGGDLTGPNCISSLGFPAGCGVFFELYPGGSLQTPTVTPTPSSSSITTSQAVTVTVAVNGASGDPTPTGTVTLSGGGYTSAATALSDGSTTIAIPAGSLAVGIDTLTASYTPDTSSSSTYNNASGSTSVTVTAPAKLTPAVTVTPASSNITTAQSLTVTSVVSGRNGNPTPTGSVKLTSGSYTSATTTLSSGNSTIIVAAGLLAVGSDALTASYSGDSNYIAATGSTSVTVSAAVPPSFTIGGSAVTVSPGAATANTSTITVTPAGGFTGSVALTASFTSSPAGAQDPPTVSFGSTSPVSITGTNAGTATLTITTTAASSSALADPKRNGVPWYEAGGAVLACVLLVGIPARRRRWRTMIGMLMLLVALTGGVLACGGGSGGGGSSNPGTTAGTYAVTVTGTSGATTATGTVNLTVQ